MKHIYSLIFILLFYSVSYSQNPCPGIVTIDYGGQTYHTVQIGSQCWLKENLNAGTMINGIDTSKNNSIIEKYCYNNDSANCTTYGGLYQWNEAMQYITTEKAKGICPTGWHIPSYTELTTLSTSVSGDGNKLKAIGQGTGAGAGTNTSGFSALMTGYRSTDGNFGYLGNYTFFWSSTEIPSLNATYMRLTGSGSGIDLTYYLKGTGYNVRCLNNNIVGVNGKEQSNLPKEFLLAQNYPNPFNPSTTINFSIPKATHVSLSIYNSMGKEVSKLISKEMNAGVYTTEWNASGFASGVYYYRVIAGNFIATKKLILLK
jgi:uncharacterized protein (TIGR02145 family)